jgi:hypothetical protein
MLANVNAASFLDRRRRRSPAVAAQGREEALTEPEASTRIVCRDAEQAVCQGEVQKRESGEQPLPKAADARAMEDRRQEQEPDTDTHTHEGDFPMAP